MSCTAARQARGRSTQRFGAEIGGQAIIEKFEFFPIKCRVQRSLETYKMREARRREEPPDQEFSVQVVPRVPGRARIRRGKNVPTNGVSRLTPKAAEQFRLSAMQVQASLAPVAHCAHLSLRVTNGVSSTGPTRRTRCGRRGVGGGGGAC